MSNSNFTSTRISAALICASFLSLLAACATPDNGYYDTNGNWIPNNPYNSQNHTRAPLPGGTHDYRDDRYDRVERYDRAGYYDRNGYYIARDGGPAVPEDMFPPRGMCRVWFIERPAIDQPKIESCDDIRSRVPVGAYVIYGG